MIGRYLRWRLRRVNVALADQVKYMQRIGGPRSPEYQRAAARVRTSRCKKQRIIDLLVAHGGRTEDW